MEERASKQAPNDLDAEMSVLSAMLIHEDTMAEMSHRLSPEDFYKRAHEHIFKAACKLYADHVEVDHITLADSLKREGILEDVGGREYLILLSDFLPSAASASHHADIVRNKSILRNLISAATRIAQRAYSEADTPQELLDEAERQIFEIARKGEVGEPQTLQEILGETFEKIEKLWGREGGTTGVPSGFVDLDNFTAGLQPGELVIVAARPSMGKTSLAINLMERASSRGYAAALFSLEMTTQQVVQNLLCCRSQVDAHKLRRGFVSREERQALHAMASELYNQKIIIDDTSSLTLMGLRAKARRLKQGHDIKIIVIDYLQLMSAGRNQESRQQEIALISRSLKSLAKELEIPVVALAQLNRGVESRDSHRPRLSDLRESGAIEQDADLVMMLHRPEYYQKTEENRGLAELIIAKQRNGPTGSVKLRFFPQFMRFESFTSQPEPIA